MDGDVDDVCDGGGVEHVKDKDDDGDGAGDGDGHNDICDEIRQSQLPPTSSSFL